MYIIIISIIIKIVKDDLDNENDVYNADEYKDIENFESVINKLKAKSNTLSRSNKKNETNNIANVKNRKRRRNNGNNITFDDLVNETEDMDVDKYTISNIKANFWNYANSFSKDKFINVTGTTNEALDKFYLFKDKFFEIFD